MDNVKNTDYTYLFCKYVIRVISYTFMFVVVVVPRESLQLSAIFHIYSDLPFAHYYGFYFLKVAQ